MFAHELKFPIEEGEITYIDLVEPRGGTPDFAKACASLANQVLYTQGKFIRTDTYKEADKDEPKKKKKDEPEEVDYIELAQSINMLYSQCDPEFLPNMIEKFTNARKQNKAILQYNGENLKDLYFNQLSYKDLAILATAYSFAFLVG